MMLFKRTSFFILVCCLAVSLLASCGLQGDTLLSGTDAASAVPTDTIVVESDADTDTAIVITTETVTIETEQESDAESQSEGEDEPSLPEQVRLIMVGDILMHDPVLDSGKTAAGYSFSHLFENVREDISSADLALFNQEVIIAGEKYGIKGYPRFNAPFELADAIAEAGFDVALHATNHTLDAGKSAMLECLDYWQTKHPSIEVVGMHDSDADAWRISVIEKNGIRIAVLNYTDNMNPAGEQLLRDHPYLVDFLEEGRLRADVRAAREISDVVVVCVHWGSEYTHTPAAHQRRWAGIMLECGVDLVLGTHPHVIQPVEWLESADGERMLVYWSLGNFVNSTAERGAGKGARMLGAMAEVTIEKNGSGKAAISSASAVPLITHIEYKTYGITTYRFSSYSESLLLQSEAVRIDPSFTYSYCTETFEGVLGDFIKK
ncbi:MAG: CapA family protein [Clostridia bacterium]|nr:CapA family protein [Clostridia bacterium]